MEGREGKGSRTDTPHGSSPAGGPARAERRVARKRESAPVVLPRTNAPEVTHTMQRAVHSSRVRWKQA